MWGENSWNKVVAHLGKNKDFTCFQEWLADPSAGGDFKPVDLQPGTFAVIYPSKKWSTSVVLKTRDSTRSYLDKTKSCFIGQASSESWQTLLKLQVKQSSGQFCK